MTIPRRLAPIILSITLMPIAVACSSAEETSGSVAEPGSTEPPTSTAPDTPSTMTTAGSTTSVPASEDDPSVPVETQPPLFDGLGRTVTLLTPESGSGIRPLLEWEPVDGADYYSLFLYAPSGRVYWGWAGRGNAVHVGGEPQIQEDRPGASIVDGMSWAVIAYDAESLPIAVSPQRPISP